MSTTELVTQLKALIRGLWFPSETEAPWTLPTWNLNSLEVSEVRRVLRRAGGVAVAEITIDDLTEQVDRRCQGYGDEGTAIAQQHRALAKCLKHHCDTIRVFRVGH
ncbi:MAG: nuclease A inhibitor family protein, partial [Cyanobacteria bacterium J06626_18]